MVADLTNQFQDRLLLRTRLAEIAKLPAWIETLAVRYAVPTSVKSAMSLCLEEMLSNIIRHGYGAETNRPVIVQFTVPHEGYFVLVVDDEAPHFNPLDAPELPALDPGEPIRVGGQGIRLLRRFADTLEYEPTPAGNRLRVGFRARQSAQEISCDRAR
jgi:anti-sigma regulatory factor (Ser/Thr protein kinase)